jgi:SHS2 domain-containing protein
MRQRPGSHRCVGRTPAHAQRRTRLGDSFSAIQVACGQNSVRVLNVRLDASTGRLPESKQCHSMSLDPHMIEWGFRSLPRRPAGPRAQRRATVRTSEPATTAASSLESLHQPGQAVLDQTHDPMGQGEEGAHASGSSQRLCRDSGAHHVPERTEEQPEALDAFPVAIAEASILDSRGQFTYLDHTADVMIHAWSSSLPGAFAQCLLGLYGVMLNVEQVRARLDASPQTWSARGHDLKSLLYDFLSEALYRFHVDGFVAARVLVTAWQIPVSDKELFRESDLNDSEGQLTAEARESYQMQVTAFGEAFDPQKHGTGTEVKAITYSAMTIRKRTPAETAADNDPERVYEVFVIVDI